MPYLIIVYLFAYIDRANVSIAKIKMQGDLGFDDSLIGFAAGIFFVGYFLFEVFLVINIVLDVISVVGAQAGSTPSFHQAGAPVVVLKRALASTLSLSSIVVYMNPTDISSMKILTNSSLLIDDEVVLVTQMGNGSFNVARGQAGTIAVAHQIGTFIRKLPTYGVAAMSEDILWIYLNPMDALKMDIAVGVFVMVDDEIVLITSLFNGNISVIRGQADSTISSHLFGSILIPLRRVLANYMSADSNRVYLSPADITALGLVVGDFIQITKISR